MSRIGGEFRTSDMTQELTSRGFKGGRKWGDSAKELGPLISEGQGTPDEMPEVFRSHLGSTRTISSITALRVCNALNAKD